MEQSRCQVALDSSLVTSTSERSPLSPGFWNSSQVMGVAMTYLVLGGGGTRQVCGKGDIWKNPQRFLLTHIQSNTVSHKHTHCFCTNHWSSGGLPLPPDHKSQSLCLYGAELDSLAWAWQSLIQCWKPQGQTAWVTHHRRGVFYSVGALINMSMSFRLEVSYCKTQERDEDNWPAGLC